MPVATVAQDGTFAAGTKLPGDGVLPGKYKLTVVWRPNVNDDGEGRNLLPARYSNPNTSNLVVEVGPESGELPPFQLLD